MKMMVSKFGIFSFQKSIFGFHISLREWKKIPIHKQLQESKMNLQIKISTRLSYLSHKPNRFGTKGRLHTMSSFLSKGRILWESFGVWIIFGNGRSVHISVFIYPKWRPYDMNINTKHFKKSLYTWGISSRWIIHNDFLQVIHVINPWSWSENGAKTSDQPEIFLQTVKQCALLFMDKIRQKQPVDTVDGSEIRQTTWYISFPDHCHCIFMKLYEKVTQSWFCDWNSPKKNSMGSFSRVKYILFLPESYLSRKRAAGPFPHVRRMAQFPASQFPPMGWAGKPSQTLTWITWNWHQKESRRCTELTNPSFLGEPC